MTKSEQASFFTIRKIATVLLILIVAGTFVELGMWQLHRAQEVSRLNRPKTELPIASLSTLTKPGSNLAPEAINRLVKFSGRYVRQYSAEYQSAVIPNSPAGSRSQIVTLIVGLMNVRAESGTDASVLVVRGVGTGSEKLPTGLITVTGRLYPRQTEDRTGGDPSHLSRIDPSLVVSDSKLPLIDGYVVATVEKDSSNTPLIFDRIASDQLISKVAGFYWQHISYVFIWWILALLVLVAPFSVAKERREGKDKVKQ